MAAQPIKPPELDWLGQGLTALGLVPQRIDKSVGQIAPGVGQIDPATGQINTAAQDQSRAAQMSLLAQLQQMAMGQGPSLAQGVMQQGLDQSMRNAMSMGLGAQQRGMNPGSAMRQAMRMRAQSSADAMNQGAQLRMAEQMGAMNQLGGLAGGMRSQDLGLAQQQAANSMGIAGQNAGNALGLAGQNAQNALDQQRLQAGINQAAAQNFQSLIGGIGQGITTVATMGAGAPPTTYAKRGGMMSTPQATGAGASGLFQNGAYTPMSAGGLVQCLAMGGRIGGGNVDPGGARAEGPRGGATMDSPALDTVPAMLSPGEIVLPRSVAQAADAPEKAAAFVEMIRRQHRARPKLSRAG